MRKGRLIKQNEEESWGNFLITDDVVLICLNDYFIFFTFLEGKIMYQIYRLFKYIFLKHHFTV